LKSSAVIVNKSKDIVIARQGTVASTFGTRLKGLLGQKESEFKPGMGLIIRPCRQVHTFFMRFSIDVLFVDHNLTIIKMFSDLQPYRVSPLVRKAGIVIELPRGTIAKTGSTEGDLLKIITDREDWL